MRKENKQTIKANNLPTIKADDFVEYDGMEEPCNFTNFQELAMTVEILRENLDEIASILQKNDIVREEKVEAPYFDMDDLYNRLEEE